MSTDIALDLTEHDICISDTNDLVMVVDADQVVQHVKIRLLSYLGEWFLNINDGTPYFESILGRVYQPQDAAAIIRRRILDTPGVDSLQKFEFSLTNRNLLIFADVNIGNTTASVSINEDL